MNTIQRVTKNVSVLFISQILNYVLGFFTLMFTARYLGVDGFGTLSFALAFTGIMSVCMDMGLNTLTIREVARDKSLMKEYIANTTLIKLILTFFTFFIIFLIINILGYNQQTIQVIYFITAYTALSAFSQLFYAVFQANEEMEYKSLGSILTSFLLFLGVLVVIYNNFNITQLSAMYTIVGACILTYTFIIFSWKFYLPKLKFNKEKWKSLLKESWPFAITGISINLYLWIDTIILSLMQGPEAVGLYNASYKLILVLLFIPGVFNDAIFPIMSQYYISSKEDLKTTFEKLFKIMMLIAIPMGVGTVIIANKVIILIYGENFIGAVIALQILIWSTVLIFARSPFERLLESSDRQRVVSKIFMIGVFFNVILNLIVIPHYSYIGAGIITVLTDTLVLGLLLFVTRKLEIFDLKKTQISLLKIIFVSVVMGIIINYLLNLNLFLLISLGTIIYIMGLILLKIFDDDEILMMKSIFKRRN